MRPSLPRLVAVACVLVACRPSSAPSGPISPTVGDATQPTVPDSAHIVSPAPAEAGQCRASHAVALHLLPDRAQMVFGADVDSVVHSPAYAPFLANDAPGELKRLLGAATTCGIGRAAWRSVTFATTFNGESGGVVRAEGAGSLENLRCIQAELKRQTNSDPFTIATTPTGVELQFPDDARGWIVDPCTVLVVSKQWVAATRDRMEGRGISLGDGRLASTIARADASKHAWVAATIDGAAIGPPLGDARDLAVTVQWTDRATASASMSFSDPAAAAKASADIERQFQQMAGMLAGMGLPGSFASKMKIGPAGAFVMLGVDADEKELSAFATMFKSL